MITSLSDERLKRRAELRRMADEAIRLYDELKKCPEPIASFQDADTVLADFFEETKGKTGMGREVLQQWLDACVPEDVERMFETLTGVDFETFVKAAYDRTTRLEDTRPPKYKKWHVMVTATYLRDIVLCDEPDEESVNDAIREMISTGALELDEENCLFHIEKDELDPDDNSFECFRHYNREGEIL